MPNTIVRHPNTIVQIENRMNKAEIVAELTAIGCEKLSDLNFCLVYKFYGCFYFDIRSKGTAITVTHVLDPQNHPILGTIVFDRLFIEKINTLKDLFSCYILAEPLVGCFEVSNN